MRRIYLDYAATTPTHPEVVKTMLPYLLTLLVTLRASIPMGSRQRELLRRQGAKLPTLLVRGMRKSSLPAEEPRRITLP